MEPWYGTDNVYTKKAIEKILLLSYCVNGTVTSFDKVFEQVKKKARDWLINTPTPSSQVGNTKKEKRSDEEGEAQGKFKAKSSYIDNYEYALNDTLLTERLANDFLKSCNSKDHLVLEVMFGVKDISLAAQELNVSENMFYKQRKQLEDKIKQFMKENKVEMEEGGELLKTINAFLNNAVV